MLRQPLSPQHLHPLNHGRWHSPLPRAMRSLTNQSTKQTESGKWRKGAKRVTCVWGVGLSGAGCFLKRGPEETQGLGTGFQGRRCTPGTAVPIPRIRAVVLEATGQGGSRLCAHLPAKVPPPNMTLHAGTNRATKEKPLPLCH